MSHSRAASLTGALLAAAAAMAVAAEILVVARPGTALLTLVEAAAFMVPGILLVRAAAGPAAGWLAPAAFGPLLGLGLSSLALLGLWSLGARGTWILFAAPAAVCVLTPAASFARDRWPFPVALPADRMALAALLLLVPLLTALPFAHVGKELRVGKAYRAYFTADYVWRRAVVAEVAKGDLPPANPFYEDDALHYYWMPHLSTAVSYRNTGADLDALLLLDSITVDVVFVAFLYGLARWFGPGPCASALGVATAVTATSYEGAYMAWEYWDRNAPLTLLRYLNIDGMTRWRFEGMPIDGLQRVLFYQPHHALGYALGFMGVLAVTTRRRRFDPMAMAVGGVLLGLGVLVSSFAGLMLTSVAAMWEGVSVVRWRDWWRAIAHVAAASLPLVLAAALVMALQYVDVGSPGSVVRFAANPLAFKRTLWVTTLSFGPIIVLTAIAAWAMFRARDGRAWVFVALWVTCVAFYFFVDIRDHQDVYVGWRVGHLWFIASAAIAAIAYRWLAALRPVWRAAPTALTVVLVLVAIPTTIVDVYNTQDVYNWNEGPGFTWTLILSPEEEEAFAWIRANTPPDAVFQVDALQRDVQSWAHLPAFAERRLAVGLPISMVPLFKYEQGARAAAWIFDNGSASAAHHLCRRNNIQYLYLGTPERRRHPTTQARFDAAPEYFERVFHNREAAIYRVK